MDSMVVVLRAWRRQLARASSFETAATRPPQDEAKQRLCC